MDLNLAQLDYSLGYVVTTVDAVRGHQTIADHPEAMRQAAVADRLLVTKTDLATPEQIERIMNELTQLNPTALIRAAIQGEVPLDWITEGDANPDMLPGVAFGRLDQPFTGHSGRVRCVALRFAEPLPYQALAEWIGKLLGRHAAAMLRVKGVVRVAGEDQPMALHGVQDFFHPPRRLPKWPDGIAQSTMVFILDGLDPDIVREAALAEGLTPMPESDGHGHEDHHHAHDHEHGHGHHHGHD
jgi:G3E family GTPase